MDDEDPMSSLNYQAGQERVVVSFVTAPCRKNTHDVHLVYPIYNMARFNDGLYVADEAPHAFIEICLHCEIHGELVGLTMGVWHFKQKLGSLVADHGSLGCCMK